MGRNQLFAELFCKRIIIFAACAGSFVVGASADASPWSRENNHLLIISRADYFTSDLGELSVGGEFVKGKFERVESNTYAEFGLTDRLMIGGKVFYGTSWLTRGDVVETASGFSEIEGFAQYQLFRHGWHAGAVKVAVGAPADVSAGVRSSLQSNGADVELSALYGRSFPLGDAKLFAATEFGYRKRISDSSDQIRFLATLGVDPNERWTFLLDTYSVKSVGNERPGGADYDIIKIQPSIIWRASKRFAVEAGVTEEIVGRNIVLGRTYFLGLRTRF